MDTTLNTQFFLMIRHGFLFFRKDDGWRWFNRFNGSSSKVFSTKDDAILDARVELDHALSLFGYSIGDCIREHRILDVDTRGHRFFVQKERGGEGCWVSAFDWLDTQVNLAA